MFFLACGSHGHILENLKNKYCVAYIESACNHCMEARTHADHMVITVYMHVHKDVVTLDGINTHIDFSGIQVYRIYHNHLQACP
ncbi:putative transcription factor interactor and regulator Znf-B family [Helianthus anomalus]